MINRAFIEVMTTGDAKGRVFTFPIPTYNITQDFDWEHPNCRALFEMTAKYGMPYFQNFLNSESESEHDPLDVLPAAARSARTPEARQRTLRLGGEDGLDRRRDAQLRAYRLPLRRRRDRALRAHRRAPGACQDILEIKRKVIQR